MGLPWVRLDTAMPDHPKIIALCDEKGDTGMAAAFVWVCSIAYSGKHGTDGLITKTTLARINGKAKHAALLVQYRLWDLAERGWLVHDYGDRNPFASTLEELQSTGSRGGKARAANMTAEERSASAKRAADARWGNSDA